jgi:hypothetical protein
LLVNGETVVVEKVQHEILERPITVYNLEVEDNHNYFVAGNTDVESGEFVLVHNLCYRQRLIAAKGNPGKGFDAHHQIPQQIKKEYGLYRIIDIDDPKYMKWMKQSPHRSGAQAYNNLWRNKLDDALNSGKPLTKKLIEEIWNALKNNYPK